MLFRDFCATTDVFTIGDIEVTIAQIPLMEWSGEDLANLIGNALSGMAKSLVDIYAKPKAEEPKVDVVPSLMNTDHLKKFRISLRHPKSATGAKLGHYLPQVMYVFAKDQSEAKDKVERYVRTKLEPIENAEDRRFPKNNFLRDIENRHMGISGKQVKTWNDFKASLKDLSSKKHVSIWDTFNEKDLQLILKQAKKKSFQQDLGDLTVPEIKLLKKVYSALSQDPDMTPGTRSLLDPAIDKLIRSQKGRQVDQDEIDSRGGYGSKIPGWNYWSVFEPKDDEEEAKLLSGLNTVRDVFNSGMKYGIPPKDIRGMVQDKIEEDENNVKARRRLYDDMVAAMRKMMANHRDNNRMYWRQFPDKKPKVRPLKMILQDGDPDSREMRDAGINWGRLMEKATEGNYHDVSADLHAGYGDNHDANDTSKSSRAEDFLWSLLSAPRPHMQSRVTYYRSALEELLNDRMRNKSTKRDDDIPF